MCGRFRSVSDAGSLMALYGIKHFKNFDYNPNVAPTDYAPIIRLNPSGELELENARFGLIPSWAKDTKIATSMINAKSETIQEKPAYRNAFELRRCVVPVEGFYEWKTEDGKKIPYMVHRKDEGLMSLAAIWECAEIAGEKINSFCIITGPPSKFTTDLHDRAPIILDDPKGWIIEGGTKYFQIPNDNDITMTRKNPAMNKPGMKDKALIDLQETGSNLLF